MGLLLDKPVMDRLDSRNGGNEWLSFGMSSAQGYRQTMEDRSSVHLLQTSGTGTGCNGNSCLAFFGVFDGHGGDKAAQFASSRLLDTILAVQQQQQTTPTSTTTSTSNTTGGNSAMMLKMPLEEAIVHGFLLLDSSFRVIAEREDLRDGCTAVTAFIHCSPSSSSPSSSSTEQGQSQGSGSGGGQFEIVVPNVGDSRCVLSKQGLAVQMSDDHKPTVQAEFKRILAAGGTVFDARVQGDLALSRAIGDFSYKSNFKLPADAQMVIAKPELKRASLVLQQQQQEGEEESFLILACDGVWDVMTNQQAVDFVKRKIQEQRRGVPSATDPNNGPVSPATAASLSQQQQQPMSSSTPTPYGILPLSSSSSTATRHSGSTGRKSKGSSDRDSVMEGAPPAPVRIQHPPCPSGINLASICDDMIDLCINELGSKDNISVIIVLLHKKPVTLSQTH